jgi:hypothetical protein
MYVYFGRLRLGNLVMAMVLAAAVAGGWHAEGFAQAETPAAGSPLRKAILDAVRPMAEAEVGEPVEFVVTDLRVLGEWAFVRAVIQRPGGGEIEYVYTRYQSWVDAGAFGGQVITLLRQTPKGWLIYEYDLGATDVVWDPWDELYPVPREVFP